MRWGMDSGARCTHPMFTALVVLAVLAVVFSIWLAGSCVSLSSSSSSSFSLILAGLVSGAPNELSFCFRLSNLGVCNTSVY